MVEMSRILEFVHGDTLEELNFALNGIFSYFNPPIGLDSPFKTYFFVGIFEEVLPMKVGMS